MLPEYPTAIPHKLELQNSAKAIYILKRTNSFVAFMSNRLVHAVHSLIAFGLPYTHVHRKKDAHSQRMPGIRHRQIRHSKYQKFGRTWNFADSFPAHEGRRVERIRQWRGAAIAEEYMVSSSHDVDDRIWDFEGMDRLERAVIRKNWEAFCAWLVLNPDVLKKWAGVYVAKGRVQRFINGTESWEFEPELIGAYASLRNYVLFLLRRDKALRAALAEFRGFESAINGN